MLHLPCADVGLGGPEKFCLTELNSLEIQNHIYLELEQYYKNLIGISHLYLKTDVSLVAWLVKNAPAMEETPVWFLDQEDLLEEG